MLVDVTDIAGDYPNTSYVTSRSFLKSRPDAVKVPDGDGVQCTNTKAIRPSRSLSQKFLDEGRANAKAAYEAYVKVCPDDLRPSPPASRWCSRRLQEEPKAAAMKPEQFVDPRVLDALADEGFFKRLKAAN